jgi:hypothetical protein
LGPRTKVAAENHASPTDSAPALMAERERGGRQVGSVISGCN